MILDSLCIERAIVFWLHWIGVMDLGNLIYQFDTFDSEIYS